jgi:hypothetical protein
MRLKAPPREVVDMFRRVFDNPHGHDVLAFMLDDLGFFIEACRDEKDAVLQNYAKRLLNLCGLWDLSHNPGECVKALFKMPGSN